MESKEEKPGELQKEAGKALAEAETALAEVRRAYDEAAGEKRDEDPDWIRAKKAMEAELDSCITVWRMNSLIFERSGTAVILRAANSFTICQVKKELSSHISKALADIGFSEWKLELFNAEQQKAHTEQQEKSEKLRRELERAEARVKEAARAKAKAAEEAKLEALSPDEKFELLFETYPVKKERNGAKNVFMGLFSEGKLPPMAELFRSIKEHLEKDAWWRTKMPPLLKNWLEKEKWMDVPYGY